MISILVLTYNHEKYIAQTLDSILEQETQYDYEIVIGEDKSTDGTLDICEAYAEKYPDKIILLKRPNNLGEIKNFASTFEACTNKYIAYCEGDDFWLDKNKLQAQVDFLEKNPDYVIHFTECKYADPDGKLFGFFSQGRGLEKKKDSEISVPEILEAPLRPMHISGCMMRRGKVDLPPSYLETPILDTPFLFYNCDQGKVYFSSMVSAAYRKHPESITTKSGFTKEYLINLEKMFLRLDKELAYKYSQSINTTIANRHILAIRSQLSNKWSWSQTLPLLFYMSKSKSFNIRDWTWIIKNHLTNAR